MRLPDPSRAPAGVFTCLTPGRAREESEASAERHAAGTALGPLDGVRVSWKDLFDVAGTPTTCGSMLASRMPAARDAGIVSRLADAGAVCIGKTNLSEFAFSGLGLNPHFGTPRNPALPPGDERLCGGSSCGAAAAVAHGFCDLAVCTDTSGSARVPAAFTGLLGFRAGCDRYPKEGLWSLAPTLDAVGFISRSAELIRAADEVLTDPEPPPATGAHAMRFVVDNDVGPGLCDDAVLRNQQAFVGRLRQAGAVAVESRHRHLAAVRQLFSEHGTLVAAEALHTLGHFLAPPFRERLDPLILERLEQAAKDTSARRTAALRQARLQLIDELASTPPDVVFLAPTTPGVAPCMEAVIGAVAYHEANRRALSLTMPGSFLDMPSLTVPSGLDEHGAPTAVQLSVPQRRERQLLQLACWLQEHRVFEISQSCHGTASEASPAHRPEGV